MSIIKHVTSQKIVAHDFRYDARILHGDMTITTAHMVHVARVKLPRK